LLRVFPKIPAQGGISEAKGDVSVGGGVQDVFAIVEQGFEVFYEKVANMGRGSGHKYVHVKRGYLSILQYSY